MPVVPEPKPAIIVTGGAHGIGRATCLRAIEQGFTPIVFDLDEPDFETCWYEVDIADFSAVTIAVKRAWSEHKTIGLVNNAGVVHRGSLMETTPSDFMDVLRINVGGAYAVLHEISQHWIHNKIAGNAVNVTSAHAVLAQRNRAAYAASKAGLESLTRSAALELGAYGIGVFGLAAGYTQTEEGRTRLVGERAAAAGRRVPLGRVVVADEVAMALVDLVTGRYPAMTGQIMRLDGGWAASDVSLEDLKI